MEKFEEQFTDLDVRTSVWMQFLLLFYYCGETFVMSVNCLEHYSSPAVHRTRRYSDLQPDTVSSGLLQRCVVWCSSQQYS